MSKRFIITLATILVIGAMVAMAVLLVKGYTFSSKEGWLVGTGIISVSSLPDGASVYIDGHLTSATNTTISQLKPKTYQVKIVKEGFIPWEKNVEVTEGMVAEVKATLFPALPTIYPLTFNGVMNVLLSADGQKLAFTVPGGVDTHGRQKGGVWIWTMSSQPISFARGAEPHQIVAATPTLDFSQAELRFSPDSNQLLATLQEGGVAGEAAARNFLLPVDRATSVDNLKDVTPNIAGTLQEWDDDQKTKDESRIAAITDIKLVQIASSSAVLRWSPDETKFISGGVKEQGGTVLKGYKVYDLINPIKVVQNGKTVPTPALLNVQYKVYDLPEALAYHWLPDSRHVIIVQKDKIAISDFDGSNVAIIYAGTFAGDNIFPWPDSSRLVLLTSFPTPTASTPNLFGINLK